MWQRGGRTDRWLRSRVLMFKEHCCHRECSGEMQWEVVRATEPTAPHTHQNPTKRQVYVCSVVPNSLPPHGLQPSRLLCAWSFSGNAEQASISYSRGSSRPRDWTWVSCISCTGRWVCDHCVTQGSPKCKLEIWKGNSIESSLCPYWCKHALGAISIEFFLI